MSCQAFLTSIRLDRAPQESGVGRIRLEPHYPCTRIGATDQGAEETYVRTEVDHP